MAIAGRRALTLLAAAGIAACATAPLRTSAPGASPAHTTHAEAAPIRLPTGTFVTPTAAPGARLYDLDPHLAIAPGFRAGNAVATALSPDGATLLVLTSGFNRVRDEGGYDLAEACGEYVFVYDVHAGAPREVAVLHLPNTFVGIAFDPSGTRFYVSGGPDDVVHEISRIAGPDGAPTWIEREPSITLGHLDAKGLGGLGINESPFSAGLALSASGARLVVANHENDSLSVVDTKSRTKVAEIDLRPGHGVPGGEFPAGIAVVGESLAYVAAQRDREVVEVDLDRAMVTRRIRVGGAPTRIVVTKRGDRLFVANANSDTVSIVDRARGTVVATIDTTAPPGALPREARALRGSNPNALALSPDEKTLYVTNGGDNTLAVLDLTTKDASGADAPHVVGLVPTGFYPSGVSVSHDGTWLYVADAKSPSAPNPAGPWSVTERSMRDPYAPGSGNQFSLQLVHGGLLALPTPPRDALPKLTARALANARMDRAPEAAPKIASLAGRIKHVIFVIGENRTYDQILGDVPGADGDPRLVHWGAAITPNQHALATRFVTLDRFFDSGGVSGDGWQWTTSGRTTDVAEKAIPLEYAGRGHHSYDWEGSNRNVNVALPTVAERRAANPRVPDDADLLPGTADVGAVDGPAEGGRGFLWDLAIAKGLAVRNYGAFVEDARYGLPDNDPAKIPPLHEPHASGLRVATATKPALLTRTDPYYRGFDMAFADTWRVREWQREFAEYTHRGDLPALEVVRLPHDHMGAFGTAKEGVDTPDTQQADHDYALGLLVESVAASPYWEDTVIVVVEDDAQNGSDHVDAHRSLALFAGGHVRRGAVVHTSYSTPSLLRTIEMLLGLPPLGRVDAFAPAMDDVFDEAVDHSPFFAVVPEVLRTTMLPLPQGAPGDTKGDAGAPKTTAKPRGTAAFWAAATEGFDFSREDAAPTDAFNRVLYCQLAASPKCTEDDDDAPSGISAGRDARRSAPR